MKTVLSLSSSKTARHCEISPRISPGDIVLFFEFFELGADLYVVIITR